MRKTIWILILLLLSTVVQLTAYTLATGARGGMYFEIGRLLRKYMKTHNIEMKLVQSRGSMENCKKLSSNEVDLAIVQSNVALWAYKDFPLFHNYAGRGFSNITAVAVLYPETMQIIAPANSVLDSTLNVRGMRVVVGEYGSSTVEDARAVLERYGITFNDFTPQYFPYQMAMDSLMTGKTDVIFYTGAAPSFWAEKLSRTYSVKWISLTDKAIQELDRYYPYYFPEIIQSGTYPFQGETVKTISSPAMLCCRSEMSISEVYQLTKLFWEQVDQYKLEFPALQNMNPATAWQDTAIPLHPGAELYYRERGWMK